MVYVTNLSLRAWRQHPRPGRCTIDPRLALLQRSDHSPSMKSSPCSSSRVTCDGSATVPSGVRNTVAAFDQIQRFSFTRVDIHRSYKHPIW